jgi:NAD(P)-dependent dehydrogenase (short-subunit alcohol dehydrogenase family)
MSNRPIAIVSGALGGIGRATAAILADQGWDLVLTDLTFPSDTDNFLAGLKAQVKIETTPADLTDPSAAPKVVELATESFSRLDGLVNCAGVSLVERFRINISINRVHMANSNLIHFIFPFEDNWHLVDLVNVLEDPFFELRF